MKLPFSNLRTRAISAFSLPEVAISTGIVAFLMLPVLAMLAGGNSMKMLAQDREVASRIARVAASAMVSGNEKGSLEIPFSGKESLRVALPAGGEAVFTFAAFDREGNFLRAVSESEFRGGFAGIEPNRTPVYLMSIEAASTTDALAWTRGGDSLVDFEISVEQPAAAAAASRSREIFQTRIAAP